MTADSGDRWPDGSRFDVIVIVIVIGAGIN